MFAVLIILYFTAAPIFLKCAVSQQDEGTVLLYPVLLAKGAIVNKDFYSTYGALTYQMVQLVFHFFGSTVLSERFVAVFYQIAIIGSIAILVLRRKGLLLSLVSSSLMCIMLIGNRDDASATYGAFACVALALLTLDIIRSRSNTERFVTSAKFGFLGVGILLGFATSYRIDFIFPCIIVLILASLGARGNRLFLFSGYFLGLAPIFVNLINAGLGVFKGQIYIPLFVWSPGRRLPLNYSGFGFSLLMMFNCLITIHIVRLSIINYKKLKSDWETAFVAIIGVLDTYLLFYFLQRSDIAHACYVSLFILGTFFAASNLNKPLISGVGMLILFSGLVGSAPYYASFARSYFQSSISVSNHGRTVYVEKLSDKNNLESLTAKVQNLEKPNWKLFIGPSDLRRTNYNDTYLYFLFPELTPGTYYLDMEPGLSNTVNSGLAKQLLNCDVAILTDEFNSWHEPNKSNIFGSDVPNEIIKKSFVFVGRWGHWTLYLNKKSS